MKKIPLLLSLASLLLLAPAVVRASALDDWNANCKGCHGPDGAGHTKAGRTKGVKDLTDAAYQAKFTDAQITTQIKQGSKTEDGKEKMKGFADKFSDAQVADLVGLVRSFKK